MSVLVLILHKCTLFKFLAQDSNLGFLLSTVHVQVRSQFFVPNLPPEACSVLNYETSVKM